MPSEPSMSRCPLDAFGGSKSCEFLNFTTSSSDAGRHAKGMFRRLQGLEVSWLDDGFVERCSTAGRLINHGKMGLDAAKRSDRTFHGENDLFHVVVAKGSSRSQPRRTARWGSFRCHSSSSPSLAWNV
ncbi:hypothetical protein Ae201684P_009913 [Aphanomyces euteiches]|uniref:Uncharacterized protein n=1 Tax=Aphanomyces euteiches TaxID=100861 RepID=A0A6G0XGD4_9STRA|nr:hypothetical protein Ae201684_004933 [Aphanomyces euteiches]KAH9082590.1 hypothetical protein Ae201684P_009913 [Aphanomyces euteiches]